MAWLSGSLQVKHGAGDISFKTLLQGDKVYVEYDVLADGAPVSILSSVMADPELWGDTNHDYYVDVCDLSILGTHYRQTGMARWEDGDFNHDGNVDASDLAILGTNYGLAAAMPHGSQGGAPLPEPATVILLSVLCCHSLARRRGQTQQSR